MDTPERALTAASVPPAAGPDPVDVDTIRHTITRALAEGPLRRCEDYVELEALLRGHIHLLLPDADASADQLWRGSVEWYRLRCRLDGIRRTVDRGLGPGLQSARDQVVQMARDCRWLLDRHVRTIR